MPRENFNDLQAFVIIAREGSFTRAAAQMGVSQSALSHTLRALEARLGVRLLTRTTRSVSPTEAGQRLLETLAPRFAEIEAELAALSEFRDTPAGTVRITAAEHAVDTLLWPRLQPVLRQYPDIKVEISTDYGLTDIAAQRFDLGVRLGDQVAKDMIAVRIAADMRMAVVATPGYLAQRGVPQTVQALAEHDCVTLRLPTHGGLMAWEFEKDGHEVKAKVEGQWVFNTGSQILRAVVQGFGLGYMPDDMVREHLTAGRLQSVLQDWCPTFPGYHLYYPSRRQSSRALQVVIDALRHRGG
ncbi:LysR family transcriptional regulator [Pseudomonas eucalypticola]|uniref:LysR family transcriptional regulator n=1 Tax=Pseudomonas eucalypticola TaxID=2599595 RepID=A0A7D5H5U5_9PSED|nr:LysR family transcriptional regulator [Pseudomonas eucalypticola]QKZ04603.1 LysR family transcriptional regulator [Pseudomonas eucalypticola]